jgi:hypothetical protein
MIWAAPLVLASVAFKGPLFSHPDRVRFDGHCFTIDGKDTFIYSGAFHYFRCPPELWRARFKRIKEAGFNTVETYVAWNWSERVPPSGPDDQSHVDLADFDAWLKMAEDEFGLYVIVRPGPYICSEWASGGFPNWLPTFKPAGYQGMWYRGDDPVFETWSRHWYSEVAAIVRKHQLSHRPKGSHGVILWQVENEYDGADQPEYARRSYVRYLITAAQQLGIDVPIFTCWTTPVRDPKGDPVLAQAFDCPNEYPNWDIEVPSAAIEDQHKAEPWAPRMVTEFQGGWFTQVGERPSNDPIDDRQIKALTLWTIGNGLTGLNYYMLFGGTNFGDWAGQNITTSYDYNAPIREWGGGGPRYQVVKLVGRFLNRYGTDLARSEAIPAPTYSAEFGKLKLVARKGLSGATYLFFWNPDRDHPAKGSLAGQIQVSLPPFGCEVYRYQKDIAAGQWCTRAHISKAVSPDRRFPIKTAEVANLNPVVWRSADPNHCTTMAFSIWDSRFICYHLTYPRLLPSSPYAWIASSGTEIVGERPPSSISVDGGRAWPLGTSSSYFLALNEGWPNGGMGMEQPHGITGLKLIQEPLNGIALTAWRTKMLQDQKDRSLAAVGVDTKDWTEGTATDLFLPHTTGVLRTSFDAHFDPGKPVVLRCGGVDDEGWFYLNGRLVGEVHQYNVPVTLDVTSEVLPGHNELAIVIHNNEGPGGLTGDVSVYQHVEGSPVHLNVAWTDSFRPGRSRSYSLAQVHNLPLTENPEVSGPRPARVELVQSTIRFDCPDVTRPWQMVLKAGGDGFLTLNGHKLGRYWESGPQRAYYLPEPWLSRHNVLTLTVLPGRFGDRIQAAELRQIPVAQ